MFNALDAAAGRREADSDARASASIAATARTWTRAGRGGCSSSTSSPTRACRTPTFAATSRSSTSSSSPTRARTTILNGHAAGTMPPEFMGGIGVEGAANVRRFVERGGWLVAWDAAVDFAIRALGLPLRNTREGHASEEFFIPGSLIESRRSRENPLAAGMEASAIAMFADSQALQVVPAAAEGEHAGGADVDVYAEYPAPGLSGQRLGARRRALPRRPGRPRRGCRSARARRWSWRSVRTGAASRTTPSSCSSIRCT